MQTEMLIKNADIEQTRNHLRTAYEMVASELTPEQLQTFTFEQALLGAHDVTRQKRQLELGISDHVMTPRNSVDCDGAIAMVIIDSVMVVLQAIGLSVSHANRVANRAVQQAAPLLGGARRMFRVLIDAARAATTAAEKAKAYYQIFVAFIRLFGVKAIFKEIRNTMHWWDWALLAVTIVGQILLLLATEGAAIIMEIILMAVALTQLTSAIYNCVQACQSRNRSADPPAKNIGFMLMPGESIAVDERLTSPNGKIFALLQGDSNFVSYIDGAGANWQADTAFQYATSAKMKEDGNFVLLTDDGREIWSTNTSSPNKNYLALDDNGQLQVRSTVDASVLWAKP